MDRSAESTFVFIYVDEMRDLLSGLNNKDP